MKKESTIMIGKIPAVTLTLALSLLCCSVSSAQDWTKSKWGPADEIGAANYLSPAKVLDAAKVIKTGKTYSLGIEVNSQTPAYPPRSFKIYVVQPGQQGGRQVFVNGITYNDDMVEGWLGIGTQIDGLGHVGLHNVYYNSNEEKDFAEMTGLKKLGVEKIPPTVTRGVLLDMAAYLSVDMVKEGTPFNKAEIDGAAKKEGIEIREGDVVLFHTGWLSLLGKDDKRFGSVEPGLGNEGSLYLAQKGVVAIGADTWALETIPFEDKDNPFVVHINLLPKNGTYILENINTAQLAADKAYEFLFVLGQAKFTGAVQMIINPIAIR
jgi:kynurenine formamidase